MDQNQKTDSDLQKAIDDITQNTNSDPVFSDPVPAPMMPSDDLGNLDEAVGPFTDDSKPDLGTPPAPQFDAPTPPEAPSDINMDMLAHPDEPAPEISHHPVDANNNDTPATVISPETQPQENGDIQQIKKNALKDLMPLMDKININPSQKFRIYKDMINNFNDASAIEPAYRAIKDIADEKERGEALLYLIETIDKKGQ